MEDRRFANTLSLEHAHCIQIRKLPSPFSLLISNLHSAFTLGGTAETEVFGEYYLRPEVVDVKPLGIFPVRGNYITHVENLYDEEEFPGLPCASCNRAIRYGDGALLLDEKRIVCATCTPES